MPYTPKVRDVILYPVSSSQGETKLRPALCLRKLPGNYNEILVCGLSHQTQLCIEGFDEIVTPDDDDLRNLQGPSVIRLGFLDRIQTPVPGNGRLGSISEERHRGLLNKLAKYLAPQEKP